MFSVGSTPGFSRDFFMDVAMGKVQGHSIHHIHGVNHDVDIGTEDVWAGGVHPYPFLPVTGQSMEIVSSSIADSPAGTGAAQVQVYGLNHKFMIQSEFVTMNGTTAVQLQKQYRRINGVDVVSGGALNNSNLPNVGTITLQISGGGTIAVVIVIGDGKSLSSVYTIPRNYTAYVVTMSANVGKGKDVHISLRKRIYRPLNRGVFQTISHEELFENIFVKHYIVPLILPAKADIKITAVSTSENMNVSTEVCLILVHKGF